MAWSGMTINWSGGTMDYEEIDRDPSHLTNFGLRDEKLYRKAIAAYERETEVRNKFYIRDDAYDIRGNRLNDAKALHTHYRDDCSDFWRIFEDIRDHGYRLKKPKKFIPK